MSGLLPSMDDKQLDALIQAIDQMQALVAEIARLRAEVERLHLTGSERISLGWGADLLDQRGNWQSAATLRGLLARHGDGK